MPRWNSSLENNCKDILDNVIKNIRSDLYQQLLLEVLESGIENNKKIIEQFLRNELQLTTALSKHTKGYWLDRGWSEIESHIKSKENKQKNCKSVYSRQTWLEKINPITGTNYTIEEADFERNSRRPIRKEYWIKKGYSEDKSLQLANNAKQQNNKKGVSTEVDLNIRRATSKRCIEYYVTRGFTPEESKIMLREFQKHFSKEICIEKYGKIDGLVAWQKRQDDWQDTLNAKSPEEKARINRLKLTKGIAVSKAEKTILEHIKLSVPNVTHQFTLDKEDKKQYIYDIMANKKIIEYNGDFWHCNPNKYSPDYINPRTKLKAIDKWSIDSIKLQYAQDQGYEVLVVWESDFKKNKAEIIKQCIQFLTQ
jgi:hypothetical protein